jgi:predicted S18 family serine protease
MRQTESHFLKIGRALKLSVTKLALVGIEENAENAETDGPIAKNASYGETAPTRRGWRKKDER